MQEVHEARSWFGQVKRYTRDPALRIYTTEAAKFGRNLGAYDPIQLGLRLNRENDSYRGYFQDLLAWFRQESPARLGLPAKFGWTARACNKVHQNLSL